MGYRVIFLRIPMLGFALLRGFAWLYWLVEEIFNEATFHLTFAFLFLLISPQPWRGTLEIPSLIFPH